MKIEIGKNLRAILTEKIGADEREDTRSTEFQERQGQRLTEALLIPLIKFYSRIGKAIAHSIAAGPRGAGEKSTPKEIADCVNRHVEELRQMAMVGNPRAKMELAGLAMSARLAADENPPASAPKSSVAP